MTKKLLWVLLGIVAAVVAVVFAIGAPITFGMTREYPEPEQPDPAIAQGIEEQLEQQPGVAQVTVVVERECIDRCKGWRPHYQATVDLVPSTTAEQVQQIVATHDASSAERLPSEFTDRGGPAVTLRFDDQHSLEVRAADHSGFSTAMAQAFVDTVVLTTARAAYVASDDAAAAFELSTRLEVATCADLDGAAQTSVPVITGAATTAGIPSVEVQFSCPRAYGTVAVAAGTPYQPGWSVFATQMVDFRETYIGEPGDDGIVQDFTAYAYESETHLDVEVNSGRTLPDEGHAQLQAIVDQMAAAGVLNPTISITQF
ncbi:hypothetical protein [Blastococcus sp. Marseille-P5729]|uniref:hypothetical protein n=1 Tax=Blastococcus sp. Marseille-P5729 TaxID=2086582 RepID=UPI000D10EB40|nr:hypothetical protein [Blastococcus sp. Marseille-P5729]